MELVAAEPLVASPVAAAFDEDGNLYVGEMTRLSVQAASPAASRSARSGCSATPTATARSTSATSSPTACSGRPGIACWKGGVFVASPPDIWYLKDTDGDHVADVRRKVFTGFGTQNQQAMLNNLTWGLDHKIYGSTAENGGAIRHADRPDAPAVSRRRPGLPLRPGDRRRSSRSPARSSSATRSTTGATGSSAASRGPCCTAGAPPALPGPQPVSRRSPRRSRTSRRGRCRSSGSARSSAGGRSAPAGGSRTASGRPNRPGPATTSSTPPRG